MVSGEKTSRFGLDAGMLKLLAALFMLSDHLWATIIPGNAHWMTEIGRLAFPIFAFQAAEGYIHTRDFRKYAMRMLAFALISEIPFNLVIYGEMFFPFHQNTIFTLLLGLLACRCADRIRSAASWKARILPCFLLLLCPTGALIGFVDYGPLGVLTVLMFYLLRDFPGARLCQLAAMIALHVFGFGGEMMLFSLFGHSFEFPLQGFAVFSLIFIWLYNGSQGIGRSPVIKWGTYLFYPAHLMLLYLIAVLLL